jgi:prepilin-type N-terminal cleavage/methylation domain-containing protein
MNTHLPTRGFTLIELLIAIGIFAIFLLIMSGVFTRFMVVERHSIAQAQLISDLTSSLESFIKEARTGFGSTYTVDGSEVAFRNQEGVCVAYRVRDGVFERAEVTGGDCVAGSLGLTSSRYAPITSNQTDVAGASFVTSGQFEGEIIRKQGVIAITLTAKSTRDDVAPITIQNSVTSRQTKVYVP